MEDPELPVSPRKKLKLQEPSSVAKKTDTVTKMPSFAGVVRPQHPPTTEDQLSKPTESRSGYPSSFSQTPAAIDSASLAPIGPPSYTNDDFRYHFVAAKEFYRIMAEPATKGESNTAEVTDFIDDTSDKEAACGITEFVSPGLLGFSGILKKRYDFHLVFIPGLAKIYRYADFLVNEILPSGEVVHLDNLEASPKPGQNTELFGDANPSPATSIGQKAEATQRTEQNVNEHEQPSSSKEVSQAIPHADKSDGERTTLKTKTYASAVKGIPQSMQGFDQYEPAPTPVDNPEKISPHKRIPPSAPSVPLSMQDLDGKKLEPKQENTTRRKEKVHIRQTSQGWVEFDKEKEDETKKRKAEEDLVAGSQSDDVTQLEENMPEGSKVVQESKKLDQKQTPKESTEVSWQAFARNAPSNSFQVSSQSTS